MLQAVALPLGRHVKALKCLDARDPLELRRQATEVVRAAAEAELALFASAVDTRGELRYSSLVPGGGSSSLAEIAERLRDQPIGPMPTVDVEHPRRHELSGFVDLDTRIRSCGEAAYREGALYRDVYAPTGVTSDLRLLVYTNEHLVGWIGALRTKGSRSFDERDRRRLAELVGPLKASLSAADHFEDSSTPKTSLEILATPEGSVLHASKGAEWVLDQPHLSEQLAARVSAFDRQPDAPAIFHLGRLACSIVRLDATGKVAYLVLLARASVPRIKAAAELTAAQRKIAELAADGATIAEIALAVSAGEQTVKTHLRDAYKRLGVSTRVQLAAAMRRKKPSSGNDGK